MKNIIAKFAISLLIGGLVLVAVTPARAWQVGADFITGGGWYLFGGNSNPSFPGSGPIPSSCGRQGRANFGWHGGVKNGAFWGNGNYKDHECGLHVHNELVRDYVCVSGPCPSAMHHQSGTREICGNASTNVGVSVFYRVRMNDTEPESAKQDKFGIILYTTDTMTEVYGTEGVPINGGNIELHMGNRSNTAPAASNFCDLLRAHTSVDFTFD